MRLPSVMPLPGADLGNVVAHLENLYTTFKNGFNGRPWQSMMDYRRESVMAAETLSYQFGPAAVDALIRTRQHWHLMSAEVEDDAGAAIRAMIDSECRQRAEFVDALRKELRVIQLNWGSNSPTVLAPDTNVFIHQRATFNEQDWRRLAGDEAIRLMIPMQVVRELDGLKNGSRNGAILEGHKDTIKTRARASVKALRALLTEPDKVVHLSDGIELELLIDAPDHQPMESGDAEIIDRLVQTSGLIGRPILLATGDAGMEFTAKAERLSVLSMPS